VLAAADRDREHLAHVLHDGPQQTMTALRLMADTARQAIDGGDYAHAQQALEVLDRHAAGAAADLRRAVARLHPVVLQQQGLVQALAALAESVEDEHAMESRFRRPEEPWPAAPRRDAEVVHIVREAVVVAVAHCDGPIVIEAEVAGTRGIVTLDARLREGGEPVVALRLLALIAEARAARIDAHASIAGAASGRLSLTVAVPLDGAAA
jgi:signal transduction histidine kinase